MDRHRILYWNAAGLRRRLSFLRYLLQDHAVDIALISETHLPPTFAANLPGYHIHRIDTTADSVWRGLLVAVRRNVAHQLLPDLGTQTFQSLGVEALLGAHTIRAYAVYRPGTTRLRTREIHRLLNNPIPTLAAGDWNAKHPAWGCLSTCTTGRRLYEDAHRHSYEVMGPEEPTHYSNVSNHQPSTIDIVVQRGLEGLSLDTLPDAFGSDQVVCRVGTRPHHLDG